MSYNYPDFNMYISVYKSHVFPVFALLPSSYSDEVSPFLAYHRLPRIACVSVMAWVPASHLWFRTPAARHCGHLLMDSSQTGRF